MRDHLTEFFLLALLSFLPLAMMSWVSQKLPRKGQLPRLVLVSGCTGTGKSTFGMEVAINQGILKCISTDTIRQVMRSDCRALESALQGSEDNDLLCPPALFRSSYEGTGDAVEDWLEACNAVSRGIDSLVEDSIRRGVSLVLEGVLVQPSNRLIEQWTKAGGVAAGIVLYIPEENGHRALLKRRGELTTKGAEKQLKEIDRIRMIHDKMVAMGRDNDWLMVEQKLTVEPKPIELVTDLLNEREVVRIVR